MIKILKYNSIFILVVSVLVLISCQEEGDLPDVINTESNRLTKNDALVEGLINVSMSKGTEDDILDNFPQAVVKLPIDISVNDQSFSLKTKNDLPILEAVLGTFSTDADIVIFKYPLSIIFNDYTEKIINNEGEFNSIRQEYIAEEVNYGIGCFKIQFPISLAYFNSVSGDAGSIQIQNNKRLFNVLRNLMDSDVIEINYPITVRIGDENSNTVVLSNNDLSNYISSSPLNCSFQTAPCQTSICHFPPGNPLNKNQITVGCDALKAHLAHGDIIGECI